MEDKVTIEQRQQHFLCHLEVKYPLLKMSRLLATVPEVEMLLGICTPLVKVEKLHQQMNPPTYHFHHSLPQM